MDPRISEFKKIVKGSIVLLLSKSTHTLFVTTNFFFLSVEMGIPYAQDQCQETTCYCSM